ncbi:Flagellar hook-associated protein FlgK [hydrothermal vent metagenome]|uniref:Flagellar hook-associated protein FlgK n=1 Tax=hydrothermal vent metagenome TaxID=652676 RepID=A0A3B1BBV2_9ZZZZ
MTSILNIGTSGLIAYKRALDTIGHNIANVNTPGYSRQRTDLSTNIADLTGAGFIGAGVRTSAVSRMYDGFVTNQVRNSTSAGMRFEAYYGYASRLDNLIADESLSLNPVMQDFFDAVQSLADDPASMPAREMLLSESRAMIDRFNFLDGQFDDARNRLNQDLSTTVTEINTIATSIAEANAGIVVAYGMSGGAAPNDLLDYRDQLLVDLSALVSVSTVAQNNGAINVFIGNGQALVSDTHASTLAVTAGLTDANEKDITFTNTSGSVIVTSQLVSGRLGGLLDFRGEVLNPAQNELGRVAAGMALLFNAQQQLGVDLSGAMGGTYFTAPSPDVMASTINAGGGAVTAAYSGVGNLTASDYTLTKDAAANTYTLVRMSDNSTTSIDTGGVSPYTTSAIDGFTLTITAGAVAGDSFLIKPTRDAAGDIALAMTDARSIAAAGPLRASEAVDGNGLPTNTGTSTITQPDVSNTTALPLSGSGGDITLTYNPDAGGVGVPGFDVTGGITTTLLYDPATESSGKTLTLPTKGGASFTVSGTPVVGDSFVITDNSSAVGDNRNALALAAMQQSQTMLAGTATLQESYVLMVSGVGADTMRADINMQSQQGLLNQAIAAREGISGVNLDEEAANLLRFQQAYQAAAQVVNVGKTLFDTLLRAVGR